VIIPIQASDQELSEQLNILIHAQEISQDVLCINVLNVIKNNRILINVRRTIDNYNTNTSCFVIRILDIVSINKIQADHIPKNLKNCIQLLKETLKCDHIDLEEKEAIENLCSELSDIFFWKGAR